MLLAMLVIVEASAVSRELISVFTSCSRLS